jgi:hypothetical protein|tara:strand:- start:62 stop:667 length:606 start_codon:yes stop_codon:yes gene_type:complete
MNKVLILYPKVFNCYSKFERKLSRILSKIDQFQIVCEIDPNDFIGRYSNEHSLSEEIITTDKWKGLDITHAVVFDDGEEFEEQVKLLNSYKIPVRMVNILITRVINIKKETKYKGLKSTSKYEYIGRGAYWGNPHSMFEDGEDREEVIRKFEYDFTNDKFPKKSKSEAYKLAGKRLGCFCKPLSCHGDVLANYLNSLDDNK